MAKKNKNRINSIRNRRASYDYQLDQRFTAGIVLTGAEVKSIRDGKASISEAYCLIIKDELFIRGMHIAEFKNAGYVEQEPGRDRKLLLNRNEIEKLKVKMNQQGFTIIPTELFFAESGFAKLEIALAKGKKTYDKRESLKEKDMKRDMDRFV
jgi:SsrA-binding protein